MRDGARAAALLVLGALTAGLVLSPPVTAEPATATKSFVRSLVNRRVGAVRSNLTAQIRGTQLTTFSASQPGPVPLTGTATDVNVATLTIPEGSYVAIAKLWWSPITATSTGAGGEIDCDLVAVGNTDTSRGAGVGDFDYGPLTLLVTTTADGSQSITLRCRDEFSAGNPVEVRDVKLIAVAVGKIATG